MIVLTVCYESGTPLDLDRSYRRLTEGLDLTLSHWARSAHGAQPAGGGAL